MIETEIKKLTVKELEELKGRIETAIRARIRARNAAKSAQHAPQEARPVFDLERERDVWMKSRRS